jgi:hypothetical protein
MDSFNEALGDWAEHQAPFSLGSDDDFAEEMADMLDSNSLTRSLDCANTPVLSETLKGERLRWDSRREERRVNPGATC